MTPVSSTTVHARICGVRVLRPTRQFLSAALIAAALGGWRALSPAASAAEDASSSTATGLVEDYGGLPEGLGRDAVYFNCTACHSLNQFVQQRMSHEESWVDSSPSWLSHNRSLLRCRRRATFGQERPFIVSSAKVRLRIRKPTFEPTSAAHNDLFVGYVGFVFSKRKQLVGAVTQRVLLHFYRTHNPLGCS